MADAEEYNPYLDPDRTKHYRQNKVDDFTWKNPFSWPYPWRAAITLGSVWCVCYVPFARWYKRPLYSNIPYMLIGGGVTAGSGYLVGLYHDYSRKTRDAVVDHYMKLHPEDFAHLQIGSSTDRKFKDLILPWTPMRVQERLARPQTPAP